MYGKGLAAYPFTDTASTFRNASDGSESVVILVNRLAAQGERDGSAMATTIIHLGTLDLNGRFWSGVFGHHMLWSDLLTAGSF